MAIYHLSVKTVSRSDGRSATAAAAYRAGAQIVDERTGEVHDYLRKKGIVSATLFVPEDAPGWASDRAELWNKAEESEKRKNSTVAREFEVALPEELTAAQRQELAHALAVELVKHHGCAVDVAVHEPGKEGDTRNHHAHILCTTRRLGPSGFGDKTRELDDRATGAAEVTRWRERWAELTNDALARAGHAARVDHRTLKAQGIDREPTIHLGPAATAVERRGQTSQKTLNQAERRAERRAKAKAKRLVEAQLERQSAAPAPEPVQVQPTAPARKGYYHPDNIAMRAAQAAPAPAQVKTSAPPQPQAARRPVEAPKMQEAPIPLPVQEKSLAERLGESLRALLEWIKGQGGVFKEVSTNAACHGPVVRLDGLHAVQRVSKGTYSIHRLDQLDKLPAVDDPKTEIKYSGGVGKVSGPGPKLGIGE